MAEKMSIDEKIQKKEELIKDKLNEVLLLCEDQDASEFMQTVGAACVDLLHEDDPDDYYSSEDDYYNS